VLRKIFGPKRASVTSQWRKLYREELNELCLELNIFLVIKSRRKMWAGHLARMGRG